jgi:hypothetical protein
VLGQVVKQFGNFGQAERIDSTEPRGEQLDKNCRLYSLNRQQNEGMQPYLRESSMVFSCIQMNSCNSILTDSTKFICQSIISFPLYPAQLNPLKYTQLLTGSQHSSQWNQSRRNTHTFMQIAQTIPISSHTLAARSSGM